ncbi:hypothetical protein JCM8097_003629 [Rhodosporidiobolus ruineniae]
MSGPPLNTVSASRYLHLAPAYAVDPPATPFPSSSSSAPLARAPPPKGLNQRPYSQDECRQLVLEYLAHSGYLDSAKAFARQLGESSEGHAEGAQEGKTGPTTANGNASGMRTNGDAMEGVEATPPPGLDFAERADEAAERSKRERSATGGNGKAVAFADGAMGGEEEDAECGVLSKEDVQDIRVRRNIRESILSGRVSHAVDLINEHYPFVLAGPPASSASRSALPASTSTCSPQSFFVTSPPANTSVSPSDPSTPSFVPVLGASFGTWALSLSPEILSLNLQTQSFIEHMRTAYSSNGVSAPSTPTSSIYNGHTPRPHNGGAGDDAGSDAGMSASTSSLGSSSLLNVAIAQSQALREKVLKLPPGKERDGWDQESITVCGLLAYKDLSSCPVRGYLAQSRRETLAEMVNAAIMQHTGRTPLPLLNLAARQTTAFWSTLREMHVQFPPATTKPAAKDVNNGKNKPPKTYPTFDLHTFLGERDSTSSSADPDSAMRAD